jgi:hypothetical protein
MQVLYHGGRVYLIVFKFLFDQVLVIDNLLLVDLEDQLLLLLQHLLRMLVGTVLHLGGALYVALVLVNEDADVSLTVDHLHRVRELRGFLKDLGSQGEQVLDELLDVDLKVFYPLML